MQVENLTSPDAARRYYEQRYAHGYMDVWGGDRRQRLLSVLSGIELPAGARVLDFGCGSGALTALLREAFPDADVHGADISATAVLAARERIPGVTFHTLDAEFVASHASGFDLVFSHHVLEHVFDLEATLDDLTTLCAAGARMLHALPCGNEGSLAHWLCEQRDDGIDAERGGRFFFEEASHLRRLRSSQLQRALVERGAVVASAEFGYHWTGVLRLMTEMAPPAWFAMVNPMHGRRGSRMRISCLCVLVASIAALRAPTQVLLRAWRVWRQVFWFRTRRLRDVGVLLVFALVLPALLLAPISLPVEALMRALDAREWRTKRRDPAGSEMFLQFTAAVRPVEVVKGQCVAPQMQAIGRD